MDSPQHYRRPYRKTEAPDTRDGARDVTGEERGRQGLKRVVACWALCSPDNIIHAHSRHVSAKTQKGWGFCSRARAAFRLGRSELLQSQLPPASRGQHGSSGFRPGSSLQLTWPLLHPVSVTLCNYPISDLCSSKRWVSPSRYAYSREEPAGRMIPWHIVGRFDSCPPPQIPAPSGKGAYRAASCLL